VAGILGADMRPWEKTTDKALVGMCPGIEIYDLRVFDDDGNGDEFGILAALQFVRWLNKQKDQLIVHGVNLSLSLLVDVRNFAVGRAPVCEECQRLVAEGTVVVAAAGNRGRAIYMTDDGPDEGFRTLSITDPGNAEAVITVGSTHRSKPHTYGVSYFSSRGPTGDGRLKPDLLAPGEKVMSTIPGGDTERMDGTSMAAPHVSGAAALLLDRHRELIGQPARVKEVLCQSAVDLGRERYFQGHGMVDTLRALQSL
jgi:subtilisin family serine protease